MKDISKIINLLLEYNEQCFCTANFHLIHMWIADGCDPELDIIPAMKEMMGKNKEITSLSYFRPCVTKNRDNRLDLNNARDKCDKLAGVAFNFDREKLLRYKAKGIPLTKAQEAFLCV